MTKNIRITLSLSLIFFLMIGELPMGYASPIVVKTTFTRVGDTLYVGGLGPHNYTHIQDAINDAHDGDIVFVYDDSSPYYENLVVNKSIVLLGEEKNSTIIDGSFLDTVVSIVADNVLLQKFTLINSKDNWQYAGVKIENANTCIIKENSIRAHNGQGIYIKGPNSVYNTIMQNTICENTQGIYCENTAHLIILDNTITENINGIYLVSTTESVVSNNIIQCKENGLQLFTATTNTISHNTITRNNIGMFLQNSHNNTIQYNTITHNDWYGLWISNATDNTITHNTITCNVDIGIYLENSQENTITTNTLINNDNGIYVEYCTQNQITHNYFFNYKLNAYFTAKTRQHIKNHWNNNFWEHPRITPYPIPGKLKKEKHQFSLLLFDWFPLKRTPTQPISPSDINLGNTLYVGGNGPNNYSKIQDAVDNATDGDTIFVYHGIYYEQVTINKAINLIGESKTETMIDGRGLEDILILIQNGVTISNFTIQNGHFGILILNSSDQLIEQNNIINNLHGVSLQSAEQVWILKNSFTDNVYGLRLFESSDITVKYNSFNNYKLNAFFIGTTLSQCHNTWKRNYWGSPRLLPQPIFGKMIHHHCTTPKIDFDYHPLLKSKTSEK